VNSSSCGEPGKALETPFELSVPKGAEPIQMTYAGCKEEGRNDYLSGYTERYFKGAGGWGVTFVTEHGDGAYPKADETKKSDVLVSKGKDWVARMTGVPNAKLVSGDALKDGDFSVRAHKAPSFPRCEAAIKTYYRGPELWMVTKTTAYYYHEDCDICAELDACDIATGALKVEIVAHSVSCEELGRFKKGQTVVYEDCR
jgi:hypothetical protein